MKQSVSDEEPTTIKRHNVPPELQQKANDILNASRVDIKALREIVELLRNDEANACGVMHVLEVVFKNLLKRKCLQARAKEQPGIQSNTHVKLSALYEKAWILLLERFESAAKEECSVALKVCMQLITAEAKHPVAPHKGWPTHRLQSILATLINAETTPTVALQQFAQYARCLDVLEQSYKLLPQLAPAKYSETPNLALNYLAVLDLLDLGKKVLEAEQRHVDTKATPFDYKNARKQLNKVWTGIMASSSGMDEKVHRQVLVVLLERILPHLDNPLMLTDFLMDSLQQFDGPIALLALQGIFSLMQQQNITYPDVYEKLYSMFYPRMFFNKYKARLFYLADIFLTSTHLPENLVAAFVKRLARLSLKSPTEDALIMIRFICNLLMRHTGLQRLIRATPAACAVEISDPYDEHEADPIKSQAINSSLWELLLLQKHAVPEVANAARFISSSLPTQEFDLGPLLELKECDMFDEEVKKKVKQFALGYERPKNLELPQNDIVTKYWSLV